MLVGLHSANGSLKPLERLIEVTRVRVNFGDR